MNLQTVRINKDRLIILFLAGVMLVLAGNVAAQRGNSGKGPDNVVVGKVENVKTDKITVKENKGQAKKEAELDSQVQVVNQSRGNSLNRGQGSVLNNVKREDKVALISEESSVSGQVGKVVKIFVKSASDSAQSKRRAVQGVITEVSGSTLVIAHQIHRDRVNTVLTDAATVIRVKGVTEASMGALAVGQRVVAVGDLTEGGILAKRIHVIPGKATGIFNRLPVASGSATPTGSASAIPSASASATPEASPADEIAP